MQYAVYSVHVQIAAYINSSVVLHTTVHIIIQYMKSRHANLPNHAHYSRPNTSYEIWHDSKRHLYLPYKSGNVDGGGGAAAFEAGEC